jgi:uracil-DNA glycosylase
MQADKMERLRRVVLGQLESLQQAGVVEIPRANVEAPAVPAATKLTSPKPETALPSRGEENARIDSRMLKKSAWQPNRATSLFESSEPGPPKDTPATTLDVIQQEVAGCTRCEELARTRKQTVFGVGNPQARLCFLGEAPGADEDRLGEPFVGRAGQLLTKIIEACRLKREDVYILNMIKCRPPGNRNPLPEELSNCRGFLERQFDLIQPEFICCLGAVAAQNLLGTTLSIGKLRGKLNSYRGAKVVCTYHPAFLLRSPSFKKETWEDMKLLFREMGVELG